MEQPQWSREAEQDQPKPGWTTGLPHPQVRWESPFGRIPGKQLTPDQQGTPEQWGLPDQRPHNPERTPDQRPQIQPLPLDPPLRSNVPDFRLPPNLPTVPDWLRGSWDGRTMPGAPRDTVVPTLYVGKPADKADATVYKPSDTALQVFNQTKDAVARINVDVGGLGQFHGTGFFVTEGGKMATAYHVVRRDGRITVDMADGRKLNAHVVDVKPLSDLAVLQVDGAPNEKFKYLEVEPTTRGMQRDVPVFAVGHPNGWDQKFISEGRLLDRTRYTEVALDYKPSNNNRMIMQSLLHIEPGNSGSPLLNDKGKVIGVVGFSDLSTHGYGATAEDLNSLLGRAKRSDYWPTEAYFGRDTIRDGSMAAMAMLPPIAGAFARPRVSAMANGAAGWMGAITGGTALVNADLDAFQSAWSHGTTAERFNATLNASSDLAQLAGGLGLAIAGNRYRTAATLLLGGGSVAKLLNGLATDRAY